MTFRFQLEAVLNLRRSQERSERLALMRIVQEIRAVDRKLDEIRRELTSSRETLNTELGNGLVANEVHFQVARQQAGELRQRLVFEQRQQLEEDYVKQRRVFDQLRQRRETLEKLREGELTSYVREQDRRDQRQSDEWFLRRLQAPGIPVKDAGRNLQK